MSLVLELQAEAIDGRVDVDQVLRKAMAVAVKLNLGDFKQWVQLELNGYPSNDVPSYRMMRGELVCRNSATGYIPFLTDNEQLSTLLSTRYEAASIGVISKAVQKNDDMLMYTF